jgi:hypothetical protein
MEREETVPKYLILLDREPLWFRQENKARLFAGLYGNHPLLRAKSCARFIIEATSCRRM